MRGAIGVIRISGTQNLLLQLYC